MSVSFSCNAGAVVESFDSCCLCAQSSPHWAMRAPTDAAVRDYLRQHADKACPLCKGSGIEHETVTDDVNFSNGNASLVLGTLGFSEPWGECNIADFRRPCMRALAGALPSREGSDTRAPARVVNGAIVGGARVVTGGVSADGIADRIRTLLTYAAEKQAAGATLISWG